MIAITRDFIFRGRSAAGGWNRKQVEALGLSWPPRHGWQRKLEGVEISADAAERFLAATGMTKRTKIKKPKKLAREYTSLPVPSRVHRNIALTIEHQWRFLQRLNIAELMEVMPALTYMVRACNKRIGDHGSDLRSASAGEHELPALQQEWNESTPNDEFHSFDADTPPRKE